MTPKEARERIRTWDHRARGPNGRRLCKWCKAEVPKGRQTWCGDQCVDEFRTATDWNYLRRQVEQRDKGVCALCSLDTLALREEAARCRWSESFRKEHRIPWGRVSSDLWDADHITPRIRGGGNELANLRTLCIWCHVGETARLRKELAQIRRVAKNQPPLEFWL